MKTISSSFSTPLPSSLCVPGDGRSSGGALQGQEKPSLLIFFYEEKRLGKRTNDLESTFFLDGDEK